MEYWKWDFHNRYARGTPRKSEKNGMRVRLAKKTETRLFSLYPSSDSGCGKLVRILLNSSSSDSLSIVPIFQYSIVPLL